MKNFLVFILFVFLFTNNTFGQVIIDTRGDEIKAIKKELLNSFDEVAVLDWYRDEPAYTTFLVRKNNLWGAYVGRDEIIKPKYSKLILAADPATNKKGNFLFVLYNDDKIGLGYIFKKYEFKEILPVRYSDLKIGCNHAGYFDNKPEPKFIFNVKWRDKWSVFTLYAKNEQSIDDLQCVPLIAGQFDAIYNNLYHNYALVKNKQKWGVINSTGKAILPLEYDTIVETNATCPEMIGIKKNKLWGIFDLKTGKVIVPPRYDSLYCNDINYMKFVKMGSSGMYNKITRTEIITSGNLSKSDGNLFIENVNDKLLLYNSEGKKISDTLFDKLEYFNMYYTKIHRKGKKGMVDKNRCKIFIEPVYDDIEHYYTTKSQIYWLKLDGKWGFADTSGRVVLKPTYDEKILGCFIDEKARDHSAVKENGKWGVIDEKGQLITPCKYEYIISTGMYNPIAYIKLNSKQGVLDMLSGNEMIAPLYDEVKVGVFKKNQKGFPYPVDYFIAKQNGKQIFLNTKGEVIEEPKD